METGLDGVKGVIRFIQRSPDQLVIDGTIDGLTPGSHALCVHECGDISNGCERNRKWKNDNVCQSILTKRYFCNKELCGDLYRTFGDKLQSAVGEMGDIRAGVDGRAEFRFINKHMKVWELIGRSMMIHSCSTDVAHRTSHGPDSRISCGIIARSAGLFQNTKRICACDGVSQWDERDKPVAGPGRQTNQANL